MLAEIPADTFKDHPATPEATEDQNYTEGQPTELYTPLNEGEFRSFSPLDGLYAPLVCTLRTVPL